MSRRSTLLVLALAAPAAVALAGGSEPPPRVHDLTLTEAPAGPSYTPAATPWLDKRKSGGIAYFLYEAPPRIERFDLTAGVWLSDLALAEAPTAFFVDADGLYVSFGRRTSRFALDGTGEVHLRNTLEDVSELFTHGGFIYLHIYGDVISADKWTGTQIDEEDYFRAMQGIVVVPSLAKAMAPTTGVSPSDLVEFGLLPNGSLGPQADSPYHGDYPTGSQAFVFPDQTRLALDSGIVFSTADMTFAGSLAGGFDDLDFHGDVPIVLRQGTLYKHSVALLRTGQLSPANVPLGIFLSAGSIFSFFQGPSGVEAEQISPGLLVPPVPGAPVDPNGLEYEPDGVLIGPDEVVYLLSAVHKSVFRWSADQRRYLETIPLVEAPTYMAHSAENDALYLTRSSGEIVALDLGAPSPPAETPVVNSPQTPCGLATAGEFLFVCDPSGSWVSHYTYGPSGALLSQEDWNYEAQEFVWSSTNRKMYFIRSSVSPVDLHSEEIDVLGNIGAMHETPEHSSAGFLNPVRVAPDGSHVLLGSGRLYDATSLLLVDTLSTNIVDGVWLDGVLYTIRSFAGGGQIQRWDLPNWGFSATRAIAGEPMRLFAVGDRLLAITRRAGRPVFSIVKPDLSMIFADGFESGDVSAWSQAAGTLAGFLTTTIAAATEGAFGIEAQVGSTCAAMQNLLIEPPPDEIDGSFFACNWVEVNGVSIGPAGAELGAGSVVRFGNDFNVPESSDLTVSLDAGAQSGLAWVQDDSPPKVACYSARWTLRMDDLMLADGDLIEHFVGYDGRGDVQFRVLLKHHVGMGENRLALEVRQDDGTYATTLDLEELVVPSGWTTVELAWAAGDGNGYLVVALGDLPFLGLVGLDNVGQHVARVRLGHVGGTVTTSTGMIQADDFASW